jgi:hypothetical protein
LCSNSSVPEGVDEVLPLLFTILDEGSSPFLQQNMEAAGLGVEATFQREPECGCEAAALPATTTT